jgi:hypothetical protein
MLKIPGTTNVVIVGGNGFSADSTTSGLLGDIWSLDTSSITFTWLDGTNLTGSSVAPQVSGSRVVLGGLSNGALVPHPTLNASIYFGGNGVPIDGSSAGVSVVTLSLMDKRPLLLTFPGI